MNAEEKPIFMVSVTSFIYLLTGKFHQPVNLLRGSVGIGAKMHRPHRGMPVNLFAIWATCRNLNLTKSHFSDKSFWCWKNVHVHRIWFTDQANYRKKIHVVTTRNCYLINMMEIVKWKLQKLSEKCATTNQFSHCTLRLLVTLSLKFFCALWSCRFSLSFLATRFPPITHFHFIPRN